ncbi:MAG: carboxypeptidase regulatory-like domain-containing protein [Planctomycetota bacterium]
MTKSSTILTLLGVAALLWGAFAVLGDGPAPAPPAPPSVEEPSAAAEVSTVEEAAPVAAAASWSLEDEGEAGDEAEREEALLEIERSPRFVIQVWDRKRGRAAADADVFVLTAPAPADAPDPFRPHLCEQTIQRGRRYKATSEGRLELDRLEARTFIAARLPGAVGFRALSPGHRAQEEVTLRADEVVSVLVLDERGRPAADVPVGIQQRVVDRVDTRQKFREYEQLTKRIAEMKAQMERDPVNADSVKWRLQWNVQQQTRLRREVDRLKTAQQRQLERRLQKTSQLTPTRKGGARGASTQASKRAKPSPFVLETREEVKARRRTDERGVAVFRHFQFSRHRQEKWWPEQHRDRFEAVLVMPLAQPVRTAFVGRPLPAEPVELRLPATGSVTLRTVDRDGRPFTHPVRGNLRIEGGANPAWSRVQLRKEQDEAGVVFAHVGVGVQLVADCRLDDRDFRWRSPVFAGPQRPGEHVVVDLVVAPDAAMLFGRVIDPQGQPLSSRELSFLINSTRGRLEGEEVVLDRDGRFHLPYAPRDPSVAPFRFQVRDETGADVPGLARTLPMLAREGVTDLGDLQLGMLEQIAYGRVVDDLGAPVAGATVQLQRERPSGRGGDRLRFDDEAFTDARTDEDGRFQLFGDMEVARYRLRVRADGYFPEETLGVDRVTGSEIRLLRKARLVGTVRLPEWLSSKRVKVELRSLEEPGRTRDDQLRDWRGNQYIYFDWARPGLYTLTLRIQEFPEPFLRVDGLRIRPGDHDPHPRLRDLDLSSYLYRFEVFAVDEAGERVNPKTPLLARVTRSSGEQQWIGFSWRGGRIELVHASPTLPVSPSAPGFRAQGTVLSAGRSEVRFLRVPRVVVRAPGMRSTIADTPAWIGLRMIDPPDLARLDGRGGWSTRGFQRATSSYGRLGANERARVAPLMDGRYRVTAHLGDKDRGGLVEVALGEADVRLVPGREPVVVQVQAAAQALQAAMQEVQRRRAATPAGAATRAGR